MDVLGPPPEQLEKSSWDRPERSRKKLTGAFRKKSELEQMKLEYEHLSAGREVYKNYWGMQGADVREDKGPTNTGFVPDEHRRHACGQKILCMKNAVGSAMVWDAIEHVCAHDVSPTYVGHVLGRYKNRAQAKAYGDALVLSGLDILATYLGLRPPDRGKT